MIVHLKRDLPLISRYLNLDLDLDLDKVCAIISYPYSTVTDFAKLRG
jgi:hypothetical protein